MKKRVISLFLAVSMCIVNAAVPVQASGYTVQMDVESPDTADADSEAGMGMADKKETFSEEAELKTETGEETGTEEETEEETVPALNGIAKGEDGNWYYFTDGEIDREFTGFAENENGWWYINAGKLEFSRTEVIRGTVNGETAWWNVSGGKVVFTDTVAKNANGWFCIQNGKVNFSFTGFAKNSDGWWYCKNGKVDFNKTEVIKGTVNGETAWWNVSGGKVVFTDTVAKNANGWFCIQNGKVNFSFTGFAKNSNGWWYCKNGKVDFNKTEVIKGTVNGETAWWNVSGGKVVFTDTVAKNANGWFCIQNGKVNFSFTGFAKNSNGWWYCKNGKVDFYAEGVFKGTINGTSGWWYAKGGKADLSYTGIGSNSNGDWYCVNGKVDFSYSGTVTCNGVKWNVKNGAATVANFGYTYMSYTTTYSESNVNRTTNLKLACKAINGTILKNGEQFNFNQVVGERTAAKGYKDATIYEGGQAVPGIGGGICQVGTTIYLAALYSNFKINERHQHSLMVHYCKLGYDAAISYGSKNVRFTNNSGTTIKIEATCSNGKLTMRFLTSKKVSPPDVTVKCTQKNGVYTLKRYVNGVCNFTTTSDYLDD